ncbi:MAG: hypothetical protein ACRDO4_16650 [Nocardioides sp.]
MAATAPETARGLAEISQPWGLWLRRATLVGLALFVLAGALALFGVRTGVASADGGGYHLTVEHPRVARAGLDVVWEVTVRRDSPLDRELVLGVSAEYFDLFETQAFHPEPTDASRDGETMYLTFATTPGSDTFVVSYDAYIQPAAQRGRDGRVAVFEGDLPVVSAEFSTYLVP